MKIFEGDYEMVFLSMNKCDIVGFKYLLQDIMIWTSTIYNFALKFNSTFNKIY